MNNKKKTRELRNPSFDPILHIKYSFPNSFKQYVLENSSNNDYILFYLTDDKEINNEIKSIFNNGEYFIYTNPIIKNMTSILFKIEIILHIKNIDKLFFLEKDLTLYLEILFDKTGEKKETINLKQIELNYDIKCEKIDKDENKKKNVFEQKIYNFEKNLDKENMYIDISKNEKFENLKNDVKQISSSKKYK